MSPHPWPRSALRRGRITIVAIATATCFLAFAAASRAATGSVYVDDNLNVGAGHDFFGGTTPVGDSNVGVEYSVFPHLTSGFDNTAVGRAALRADTNGDSNTASGFFALADNKGGNENVATGTAALGDDTFGGANVATGAEDLDQNTTGSENVAAGTLALSHNTTGEDNVATGFESLQMNTTGEDNVAIGSGAGFNLTTGSDNVDIANEGVAGESKAIRIGTQGTQKRTFLAGVSGTTLSGPAQPVLVKANGQLGTASAGKAAVSKTTDRRFARMEAEMTRLQRQNERQAKLSRRLAKEVRALRANG